MLIENFSEVMGRLGDSVKERMIDTLLENESYNTGNLARSIEVIPNDEGFTIEMLFYGKYIEDGARRGPGKMPPISAILSWIKRKQITRPTKFANNKSFAFAIARGIAAKGTRMSKPKPFIQPSITYIMSKELEKELTPELRKSIENLIKQQ
jgi:hypothetical protein